MEKLHEYQGWGGRFHEWRDTIREKCVNWRDEHPGNVIEIVKKAVADAVKSDEDQNDYSHIHRFVFGSNNLGLTIAVAVLLCYPCQCKPYNWIRFKDWVCMCYVHYVNVGSFIQIKSQSDNSYCQCK